MKYHINPSSGKAGKCTATRNPCPFGSEDEHFNTLAEATTASEELLAQFHGAPTLKKSDSGSHEAALEARKKNYAVRRVLKNLPRKEMHLITGGYLDLTAHIELSEEYIEVIDRFSQESDLKYDEMMHALATVSLDKKADQSSSEAFMKTALLQKSDGFKNEYVLAAVLSQYKDIDVYFPTGNIEAGGKPKVDIIVSIKGQQFPISVKKVNGTQIETYTSRATLASITPGAKVISSIEATSNRIFYFRPKFQAFSIKAGEREKLRTLKDGSPKIAGASVRIEYGQAGKLPTNRPTLPEESAISAFGGVHQTSPMPIHDFSNKRVGSIANSSARLLVVGDFNEITDLSSAPSPKEILSQGVPISRNGIRSRDFAVTLRVSSMGNRTGDWVTDKSHITDNPSVTLKSYKAALAKVTA